MFHIPPIFSEGFFRQLFPDSNRCDAITLEKL